MTSTWKTCQATAAAADAAQLIRSGGGKGIDVDAMTHRVANADATDDTQAPAAPAATTVLAYLANKYVSPTSAPTPPHAAANATILRLTPQRKNDGLRSHTNLGKKTLPSQWRSLL